MTSAEEALSRIPARDLRSVLEVLLAIRKRADEGEEIPVPLITLHLAGGQNFSGRLLDLAEDTRGPMVLLHGAGHDPRGPGSDLVYVEGAAIAALTIHDSAPFLAELSFGRLSSSPGLPSVSKLDIERKVQDLLKRLTDDLGRSLTGEIDRAGVSEEAVLQNLNRSLPPLFGALREIAGDDLGRSALREKVSVLRFSLANANEASLDAPDRLLRITLNPAAPIPRAEWKLRIEAVL